MADTNYINSNSRDETIIYIFFQLTFFKGALDIFLVLINKDNFGQGCLYSMRVDMNYLESDNDEL